MSPGDILWDGCVYSSLLMGMLFCGSAVHNEQPSTDGPMTAREVGCEGDSRKRCSLPAISPEFSRYCCTEQAEKPSLLEHRGLLLTSGRRVLLSPSQLQNQSMNLSTPADTVLVCEDSRRDGQVLERGPV